MITRISDSMKYSLIQTGIAKLQDNIDTIQEQISSGKTINEPSDNPLGMEQVMNYQANMADITQYQKNINQANAWLSESESQLTSINNILTQAQQIAVAQSSGTATQDSMSAAAQSVSSLIDEAVSLANSQYDGHYLFAGTMTTNAPFSATNSASTIGSPVGAADNTFDGTVAASGTYTGTENQTYVVKIVSGGSLASATYQVSADGGKDGTWSAVQSDLSGSVNIGDGITLQFTPGSNQLAAGDVFTVHASAAGYYSGNSDHLSVDIGQGISMDYNITGSEAFTGSNANVFAALNNLEAGLESNDTSTISAQLTTLQNASNNVNAALAKVGTNLDSLTTNGNNLSTLNTNLTTMVSNTEDSDMAQLMTNLSMQQLALQATYSLAQEINQNSIFNFLTTSSVTAV